MADGVTLRANIAPGVTATISSAFVVAANATPELVAGYSSRGPGLVSGSVKPELAAVGTSVYTAAERLDPAGDLYSSSGYAAASGSSFASPMAAGAAALVLQANKTFTPAQIKSALVNTAATGAIDGPVPARTLSVGAGFLNVASALGATVTASPATIAFGPLNSSSALPVTVPVQLTNSGPNTLPLAISVTAGVQVSVDQAALSIAPAQTATIHVTLAAPLPSPGEYEGQIAITGAPIPIHIPFQYVVGSGVPYNILAVSGNRNIGTAGQPIPDGSLIIQVTDQFGVPVPNVTTTFSGPSGSTVNPKSAVTNSYGIAQAAAAFAPVTGSQTFTASTPTLSYTFVDFARSAPTIAANGVVDAASNVLGRGIAAGSYISIYGTNLAEASSTAATVSLMPALNSVSVSFDVPSTNLSVVGHMISVGPNQLNVQVPWELAGATSVQMKVNLDRSQGPVVTVPVAAYSPNFFVYGNGFAAALDGLYRLLGTNNPAARGQTISVYANGLGPVTNQPASGSPASNSAIATTTTVPVVTVGGVPATVVFCGLAPGYPALYQINLTVPANAPTGMQPMVMTIGGIVSNTATLNVQ
jgi:uncharacterized protein (TIGR03437 family)